MTVFLATPDMSNHQSFDVATHDVMCLVKRHAYELASPSTIRSVPWRMKPSSACMCM